MKVQIIEKGGHPEFAVLPFADYEAIIQRLDDLEDARDLREYRVHPEESFPEALVERLLAGENPVKLWREYRGMTQAALAEKVKVSVSHISQIETGKKDCSVKLLKALAKALNVDMELLITSEES